jgi:hypothetical protein
MKRGISALEATDYSIAIDEFSAALNEKPDDHQALLSLGIALNRSNKKKEAEVYLKKALRGDPLSAMVNLELGLLYEKMGLHAEARDFLTAVVDIAPGTSEASIAQDHLRVLERMPEMKRKKYWSARVTTGVQYDSNVILSPDDSPLPEGISDESDWRFFINLNASYLHPVTRKLRIGPTFSFYQSLHTDIDEFNTRQFKPGIAIQFPSGKRLRLSLDYDYENTSVGNDLYILSHSIMPQVVVLEDRGYFTQLNYRYQDKDFRNTEFFTNNDERDGSNHMIQISQYIPVSRLISLSLSYAYDNDSADMDFWSYNGHKLYAGIRADLGKTLVLDLSGQYYLKDYDDDYPGTDKKREDKTSEFTVSLTKSILKSSFAVYDASIGYLYMNNSSNLDFFEYDRHILTLNLKATL